MQIGCAIDEWILRTPKPDSELQTPNPKLTSYACSQAKTNSDAER